MLTNTELASEMVISSSMMTVAAPVFSNMVRYNTSESRNSRVRSMTFCSKVSFDSCRASNQSFSLTDDLDVDGVTFDEDDGWLWDGDCVCV